MEKESRYALILGFFFILSLIAAWVLFSSLESYAEVTNPFYRLGGAVAGFFVILTTLCVIFTKLIARPASTLVRETIKAVKKPRGFREYISLERGFSLYYPKEWKVEESQMYPPIMFGEHLTTVTQTTTKKFLKKVEEDPSSFSDTYMKIHEDIFKDYTVIEKSTIALRGIQCPMYIFDKAIGDLTIRTIQIAYLDSERERLHWISWFAPLNEFEKLRPLFDKIVSTFQVVQAS